MALNPSIILAGQPLNALAALDAGAAAADRQNTMNRQRGMEQLFAAQGPGIVAGDPAAINALARMDPAAAMSMQGERQRMDAQAEAIRRAAAEWAQSQDAAAVAARTQRLTGILRGAATFHAKGDRQGYDAWLRQNGADPAEYAFDQFPAVAAQVGEVLDVWQSFGAAPDPTKGAPSGYMWNAPGDPAAGVSPLPGYQKSPGVVVNTGDMGGPVAQIGTVPQGFAAIPDPSSPAGYRMERIPGGPAASEASGEARSLALAATDYDRKFSLVDTKLDEAIASVERNGRLVSGFGASLAAIPETEARSLRATLDTIRANLGFEELQAMRDSSPTGGALGQVTERELAFLQAVMGNLDQAQSPQQLLAILRDIKARRRAFREERQRIMTGGAQAATGTAEGSGSQPPSASPEGGQGIPEGLPGGLQLTPEAQSVFERYRSR